MTLSELVTVLAAIVSASAAVFGSWVGYLQYRDRDSSVFARQALPPAPSPSNQAWGTAEAPDQSQPTDRPAQQVRRRATVEPSGSASERLAKRAVSAMAGGVLACLALTLVLIIAIVATEPGGAIQHSALEPIAVVLGLGFAGTLFATVQAIRVRRSGDRELHARQRQTASRALWLAWGTWPAGYLAAMLAGQVFMDG